MKKMFTGIAVLCAAALLSSGARAADVPNFNKRGNDKEFAERVGNYVVTKARTTIKETTLQDHKFKEKKEGQTELTLSVGYKGGITRTKYTADIVVLIDTSNKDRWEVLRVDFKDNNRLAFNRKNVDNLVKEFNDASK